MIYFLDCVTDAAFVLLFLSFTAVHRRVPSSVLSHPLLSSPRPLPILVPVSGLVVTLDRVWGGTSKDTCASFTETVKLSNLPRKTSCIYNVMVVK